MNTTGKIRPCNHNCSICQTTGMKPNHLGRYIIRNNDTVICNGCNTSYTIPEFTRYMTNFIKK